MKSFNRAIPSSPDSLNGTSHSIPQNNELLSLASSSPSQPDILIIMTDQMAAPVLSFHNPDSVIKMPNLQNLAENGVLFENAYCNSPLCAPSRFSMVTGQLPSKIGAYDNASYLRSDVPTFAHMLRAEGYELTLAGKMHFIGPDQLHGFETRLTPDIYPADFGWVVNWDEPTVRQEWYHNMKSVLHAGPCVRSNQLDYDEEVMYKSVQYLYDTARKRSRVSSNSRPFCLTVSLTHPHDPYAISKEFWDLYEDVKIPLPSVRLNQDQQDPHSARLLKCIDAWDKIIPQDAILRARRAYYAACTYVDRQVGVLRKVLGDCGLADNTVIIFVGDHGDMLGERDLWYKMCWFEMSSRVPLIIHHPSRFAARRVKESVSIMDIPLTLLELVSGSDTIKRWKNMISFDGESLYPALLGERLSDEVTGEYMGEGSLNPIVMIRRRQWKFVYSLIDPPQLYDLDSDPLELDNKALLQEYTNVVKEFKDEVCSRWNLVKLYDEVLASQRRRRLVWNSLRKGQFTPWDWESVESNQRK